MGLGGASGGGGGARWRRSLAITMRLAGIRLASAALAALALPMFLLLAGAPSPAHAAQGRRGSCGASVAPGSPATARTWATSARITLNTGSAASGTQIVVSGTGWPAGAPIVVGVAHFVQTDGLVNAFDGLAQATATAAGTFTAPVFTFPRGVCGVAATAGTAAQVVAHTADGSADGAIQASAALSVVQTPTVAVGLPFYTLPRGASSILVSGSVWAPGSSVSLVAAGATPGCTPDTAFDSIRCLAPLPGAQPVVAVAAADGRFTSSVPLPSGLLPGTVVTIRAAISAAPYGDLLLQTDWQAGLLPAVAPTLTLDHATGPAGAQVTLSGDRWPASQTLVVEYCRADAVSRTTTGSACNQNAHGLAVTGYAQRLGETQIDGSGHFSLRVSLPANARPGAILFQARVTSGPPQLAVYTQTAPYMVGTAVASPLAAPRWAGLVAGAVLLALAGLGFLLWRRGWFAIDRRAVRG